MDLTTRPKRDTRTAHIGIRVLATTKANAERIAWGRGQTLTEWLEGLIQTALKRTTKAKQ